MSGPVQGLPCQKTSVVFVGKADVGVFEITCPETADIRYAQTFEDGNGFFIFYTVSDDGITKVLILDLPDF